MRNRFPILLISLALLLLLTAGYSILRGSVAIPFDKLFSDDFRAILLLRLYRILLSAIAGSSLAIVGAVLQSLLKNPLADPYVLGISSGSGLGAVVAIILGIGTTSAGMLALPFFAFLGGIITTIFVYLISKKASRVGVEELLLSGVIVASMLSGIIMFLVSVAETDDLHNIMWWLLGNTQIFDGRLLLFVSVISLSGIFITIILSRNLNIMSLGEEEAVTLGLNVEYIKLIYFSISSLITAAVVSACGMIGFVGLIIPHIARRLAGPDNRRLIPVCGLCGAIFLIACDILARRIMAPLELPIGVITAIVGGPFFIILLKKARGAKA